MFKNGKSTDIAYKGDIVEILAAQKVSKGAEVLKTSDYQQLKQIQNLIKEKNRKVNISMCLVAKLNSKITLNMSDGNHEIEVFSDYVVEESKSLPTTKEDIMKQLTKLGNTIYSISNIKIDLEPNLFIPVKVLNDLRRNAVEELNQKRLYKLPIKVDNYSRMVPNFPLEKSKSILINCLDEYKKIKDKDFSLIYLDESLYNSIDDNRKVLKLARVLEKHNEHDNDLLVGELGSVNKYKNVITDFSLNVVNSYSVALLHSLGVRKVTLSYELNDYQIQKIIQSYRERYNANPNLELIVGGRIEAMIMKYRLLSNYGVDGVAYLQDKYKNKFKVEEKNKLTYIYHFEERNLADYDKYYDMGINWLRF